MEGVGVAASLITIIVLGLQSSKFIFKTADGIKGAPTTVRKLVTAAKNISQLLEQVKGLAERAKKILGEQDAKFFEDLRPLLNDCVRDLRHIEGKIGKFAVASDHQLWNNVKTHLHEKDFDKMWNSIHHYVQLFGSQLSHAGV